MDDPQGPPRRNKQMAKAVFFRKSTEKHKSPKKSHGKLGGSMKIRKDTTLNPHSVQKKASSRNPKGKSHKAG